MTLILAGSAQLRPSLWGIILLVGVLAWGSTLAGPAADFVSLDRTLARAITNPLRQEASLAELVRRGASETALTVDARNALAQRETVTTALDRLREAGTDEAVLDDAAQADVLVDVLRSLDSMKQFETVRSIANDLPALTEAVWSRFVAPAVADAEARRIEPLAAKAQGALAGQWIDSTKSTVRVLDLWADVRKKSLAWSRVEFAERIPNLETVLERGLVSLPKPRRARLALYVDVAGRPGSDRTAIERQAETAETGPLLYILDDTAKRVAICLAAKAAPTARDRFQEVAPKSSTQPAKPPPKASGKTLIDAENDDAAAGAEERCRLRARLAGFDHRAVLFDPERRTRIRTVDLSSDEASIIKILGQAKSIARAWP